jgi:hypothetical protein
MGPLAKFLLALTNLVRSGAIKKIPQAIKFAEQQFGKVTPLLKKQIEKVFEQAKKQIPGKPGEKGRVIPFVKKTEGIETLDEFNLSKDDPMGDFEKIVKGEGDTGLPSQFTNKDIEEAIDNVSPGFVAGDTKYNAELVAEELAVSKGIDYYGLPVKDRAQIYGRAFDGLSKQRMKGELSKTDELMNFFRKEIEKADAPKLDSKENIQLGIEKLRNPNRPGGPLDPAIGVTRTLARRVLEKRGIEIGKKDPIDVFNDTFGEAIVDLKNLGEEMIEADQTGRNLKPMDDLLEIEGFFDMEIPENPNKGIPNEEMIEMLEKDLEEKKILEDFDPTFRKPNATGGLTRTSYAMGKGPVLPSDEDPINPFGPKPEGPVLPDKSMMASDDMNERLLEQLYEQFLEEGFSPEVAAEKARQFFDQMSKAKDRTSGRVQAASGGLAEILKV